MLTDAEIMAQVRAAFQAEQAEHRQAAGELLLELERSPEHPDRRTLIDQLFREAHSLKGGARAAGMPEIEQIAHSIEDVFGALRKGALLLTPEVCDPIYAALDAIGVVMEQITADEPPQLEPFLPLLATLARLVEGRTPDAAPSHTRAVDPPAPEPLEAPAVTAAPVAPPQRPAGGEARAEEPAWNEGGAATIRLSTSVLDGLLNEAGELMTCTIRARQHAREIQALADLPARWRRTWRQAHAAINRLRAGAQTLRPTVHHLDDREERAPTLVASGALSDRDVALVVDALAQAGALISEIESGLTSSARQAATDHARLAAVTDRLTTQVRRTRMLPLTTIIGPLHLQLREMARGAGKQVTLDVDDGGAEADRQVLERLRDVLVHLIRNAVDHGIEPEQVRLAQGKPAPGRISLRAAVSGDRLTLTLCDDGGGLDLDAIRRQATAGGLLSASDVARLSEAEIADLIFLPGFSTRQTVTELSGRGVGLDIVRSHVERMHGQVTVQSQRGLGCTFVISVPLSLTSSHGLLLGVGAARYVMPLDAVHRIVQVGPGDVRMLEGRATLALEGRAVALVRLGELLGEAPETGPATARLALLLGSGERQVACTVDAVMGEQELVVHRLPAPLQRVRFIAGATILADGSVVPILDVVDVVRAAIGVRRTLSIAPEPEGPRRTPTVLVVDDSITTRTLEKNILEAAGYKVQLATDGQEALEMLRRLGDNGGCDLLLSDIDMPRLNGFDLTARVRADSQHGRLPIVLVTSLDTPADRERGIAAGADAYIVKRAFDQQTLLDTIARLI